MPNSKGTRVPCLLPTCSPTQRDSALLSNALAAFDAGDHATALLAAEYLCRQHPGEVAPAVLRASVLRACGSTVASKAWELAWVRDPLNPALQDALLRYWVEAGDYASVRMLAQALLPERCRLGNHSAVLQALAQAGVSVASACWRSGSAIEGIVCRLDGRADAGAMVTLVLSSESRQSFHDVRIGMPFRIDMAGRSGVWSVVLPVQDGCTGLSRILQGSPVVFPAAAPVKLEVKPDVRLHGDGQRRNGDAVEVSVVIPVYSGEAIAKACIESVLASLSCNVTRAHLVVVDDAGPEPGLSEWLCRLSRSSRISLLRNRYNLGFIEAANRGLLHHPDHDAILLNADTLVQGDWIDRLLAALYDVADVAAVTPWSNNGEISSFPIAGAAIPAPSFQQLGLIDRAAARLRADGVTHDADLPACCGFAMMMRRSALNQLGLLDGAALVRGYGEEVDWCMRARAAGYRVRLATGVFVAHVGGVSFGLEKHLRVHQNRAVLKQRYPGYRPEYLAFLKKDPLRELRRRLEQAVRADSADVAAGWVGNTEDQAARVVAPFVVPSARSSVARVLVWRIPLSHQSAPKNREKARLIASGGLPLRLLVMGEAGEALWHTGAVDPVPPAGAHLSRIGPLPDSMLAAIVHCTAVLTAGNGNPLPWLQAQVVDDTFSPRGWLANWQKSTQLTRRSSPLFVPEAEIPAIPACAGQAL